jgi:hypothetical protein
MPFSALYFYRFEHEILAKDTNTIAASKGLQCSTGEAIYVYTGESTAGQRPELKSK